MRIAENSLCTRVLLTRHLSNYNNVNLWCSSTRAFVRIEKSTFGKSDKLSLHENA